MRRFIGVWLQALSVWCVPLGFSWPGFQDRVRERPNDVVQQDEVVFVGIFFIFLIVTEGHEGEESAAGYEFDDYAAKAPYVDCGGGGLVED